MHRIAFLYTHVNVSILSNNIPNCTRNSIKYIVWSLNDCYTVIVIHVQNLQQFFGGFMKIDVLFVQKYAKAMNFYRTFLATDVIIGPNTQLYPMILFAILIDSFFFFLVYISFIFFYGITFFFSSFNSPFFSRFSAHIHAFNFINRNWLSIWKTN